MTFYQFLGTKFEQVIYFYTHIIENLVNLNIIKSKPNNSNDSLPVLVFIHGAWHGAWCWEKNFLPFFTKSGFECYTFDLPYHGRSRHQKGINTYRISDYIDVLKIILSDIDKPHILIGHSMGGYIIQEYLEKNDCAGAILMASVPSKPVWRLLFKMTANFPFSMLKAFIGMNLAYLMDTPEKAKRFLFSSTMPEEEIRNYTNLMSSESLSVIVFDFLFSKLKGRKNHSYPVLVVSAEKDEMITISENKRTAEMQKADFVKIKNLAHDLMLDQNWEASAVTILNWMKKKFPLASFDDSKKEINEKNPKVNVDFNDAIPNLITNLGKKNSIDASKTKILGLGKSKRDN